MDSGGFPEYFEALNGHEPFPWQERLASLVAGGGRWPSAIVLPTATGKTAVIDIALYALAAEAGTSARRTGRRVFFVVDRRLIVDQAYERATGIADRLRDAHKKGEGILNEVAELLLSYGGDSPVKVVKLRGAMYRDESWANSPVQPVVCVSTVDQIGSRLLFRGYGLSKGARPIHASLVANDSLIILDEAHISQAFGETLEAISRYRGDDWAEHPLQLPFDFVKMSATLGFDEDDFRLNDEDMRDGELKKRLEAHKLGVLHCVRGESNEEEEERFEEEVARLASEPQCGDADSTLVVLNTVNIARKVFEKLRVEGSQAVLLTGRSRPYERDILTNEVKRGVEARKTKNDGKPPLFVVATQCVEVGADFDFGRMVTECASLDALVQRLGRVNRFGVRDGTSRVDIVARYQQTKKPDWLYGIAMKKTWDWMKERSKKEGKSKELVLEDLSPRFFRDLPIGEVQRLAADSPAAPIMFPAYLDAYVQTNPGPALEPDVGLFLHGEEDTVGDVQVVWRADLDERKSDTWKDVVSLLPPSTLEGMPVPLPVARAWLTSGPGADPSDLEGSGYEEATGTEGREVLRWKGPEGSEIVDATSLRPGDAIVVPSSYGGADKYGWNPERKGPVRDIAELTSMERGRPVLRLRRDVMKQWTIGDELPTLISDEVSSLPEESDKGTARRILEALADQKTFTEDIKEIASQILKGDFVIRPYSDGKGWAVLGKRTKGSRLSEWEDEDSACSRHPVMLKAHSEGVERKARGYAERVGLSANVLEDVCLAARLHDLGKVDPRFQVELHGGDDIAALQAAEPLAKSGMDPSDRRSWELAHVLSGLPSGWRHEGLSVALLQNSPQAEAASSDFDLVLHLAGSHHGWCRPFFPVVFDEPKEVSALFEGFRFSSVARHDLWKLDSGVSDRFWRLVRSYGYYGLAYLETILRLSDAQESAEEEAGEG